MIIIDKDTKIRYSTGNYCDFSQISAKNDGSLTASGANSGSRVVHRWPVRLGTPLARPTNVAEVTISRSCRNRTTVIATRRIRLE